MTVFICYRRDSESALAYAFHAKLESLIGRAKVFMDVDALQPGQEFSKDTADRLRGSSLVFALISADWEDSFEVRRKSGVPDFVKQELEMAREADIPVIPVLLGRSGRKIDGAKLPSTLKYLLDSDAEEVNQHRFPVEFETLIRRMTFSYPRLFGSTLGPVILSDTVMKQLNDVPVFSRNAIRPSNERDSWSSDCEFVCGDDGGDDFRFSVFERNGKSGVCFFGGSDDYTMVSVCATPGKATGFMRIDEVRSQYGFYWPEYYFTVCGSYGARDYYYSSLNLGSSFLSAVGTLIFNWVFMTGESKAERLRESLPDYPLGCSTRGNTSDDVVFFSTDQLQPIKYFRSLNGLYQSTSSDLACQGTVVEWSQVGGGYKEFGFVLKGSDRFKRLTDNSVQYFGRVHDNDFFVLPFDTNAHEELFAHPSGVPILVIGSLETNVQFDIFSDLDATKPTASVMFPGLGGDFAPRVSFSRDGRTAVLSHQWQRKTFILDLFTGSLIGEIPEYTEAVFSPDGERILAVKAGGPRVASVFSKDGQHRCELGLVDHPRSI
ncbi:toll/interleukin-1 receptor domain-containing protein [uncultured Tateyamaria sp.]|uniref:toll/interleukin-1 receptor domain-containing protein n=1 Tax=uncultured Tateyamaria sp. TaxID=455651 RepID=UPI00260EB618|nr:toll/interleukin-1 receptor domain-containing protein [uncultured Tateyamaria sp.]